MIFKEFKGVFKGEVKFKGLSKDLSGHHGYAPQLKVSQKM